ncbi:MAG: HD domain-containing protein [Bacteroidetes bacterium]|nr:HD domain-containing protein [Bacteroidota bacterium]
MDPIDLLEKHLETQFPTDPTGHDWAHISRVKNLALSIAQVEGGNTEVIHVGALLHDISDHKFNGGKLNKNGSKAIEILNDFTFSEAVKSQVIQLVDQISFKGKNHQDHTLTLEAKIIQDADRLDAIGAIGLARAFAYGGFKNRPIFEPAVLPKNHSNFEEYASDKSHTINHFYEKLLLLKDKINTETGKKIAEKRHAHLLTFLDAFFEEWNSTSNQTNYLKVWNTLH